MLGQILLMVLFTGLTGLGLLWLWPIQRANPCFWFLVLQWIIGVGSIWLIDLSLTSDIVYVSLYFFSVVGFLAGALVASRSFDVESANRRFFAQPVQPDAVETRLFVLAIVLLSVIVTVLYYQAVGYNVLLNLVLQEAIEDVTSARLASYSGDRYFAPGYVNQFKNVMLPLGVSILAVGAWQAQRRFLLRIVLFVGIPFVIFALLGTGQRGFFVYAFLAFLFGASLIFRVRMQILVITAFVIATLFGLMSFVFGRIDELTVFSLAEGVIRRVFYNDQIGGVLGFRYVYNLDIAWFSQWADGFLGILPTHKGSDFDHYMHYLVHGSARGTFTPSTVTSVYHNGGYLGTACVYLCMGWVYYYLYYRFLNGPRTIFRCFTYGALFFHLSFFVAGAPVSLVNKGVVTLLLMLLIGRIRFSPASDAQSGVFGVATSR